MVYSKMCNSVNASPCVTGSMGMPTFAYSSRLYSANAQKCGGVQAKIIRNIINDSGETILLTAAQPSIGGIAPDAPPMTIFIGVAGFKNTV